MEKESTKFYNLLKPSPPSLVERQIFFQLLQCNRYASSLESVRNRVKMLSNFFSIALEDCIFEEDKVV